MTSKVGLLSGGQRQALTLLMATLQKPKVLLLDEHTAALDPKTAAKVLETTEKIVNRDKLTTLMITHNMKDAIVHGNRLIMLKDGHVILDIRGEEKKKLTVEDLLHKFEAASGDEFLSDQTMRSGRLFTSQEITVTHRRRRIQQAGFFHVAGMCSRKGRTG